MLHCLNQLDDEEGTKNHVKYINLVENDFEGSYVVILDSWQLVGTKATRCINSWTHFHIILSKVLPFSVG